MEGAGRADVQPGWPRGAVEGGFLEEATQMLGFDSRIGVSQAKRHSQPGDSRTRGREVRDAMQSGATKHPGRTSEGGGEAARGPRAWGAGPHLRVQNPLESTWFRHHCADRGNRALEGPALAAPGCGQRISLARLPGSGSPCRRARSGWTRVLVTACKSEEKCRPRSIL